MIHEGGHGKRPGNPRMGRWWRRFGVGEMIGKWILFFGVMLIVVGAVVWLVESLGLSLARLPGDIRMRGEGWSFSFPIVTCIVVSVILTVLLNFFWFFRR